MVFKIEPEPPEEGGTKPKGFYKESFEDEFSFHEYLDEYYGYYPSDDLQVIPGVTTYSKESLIDHLSRTGSNWRKADDYGAAVRLITDKRKNTGAYLTLNESTGLFTMYTDDAKTSFVDDVLVSDLRQALNTYPLQVSSYQIESLTSDIMSEYDDAYSNEVILKRKSGSNSDWIPEEFDTDDSRTINYYSDDAANVIEHLRSTFDVHITSIRIKIPNKIRFKIDRGGVLKLEYGKISTLLYEMVDQFLTRMVDGKDAYESAEVGSIELGEQEISQSSPALITPIEENTFSHTDIENIIDSLPDYGYIPIDSYIESEPLYFTTNIYDTNRRSYFDIRGDGSAVRIFPREGSEDLSAFFGVLDVIQTAASMDAKGTENPLEVTSE